MFVKCYGFLSFAKNIGKNIGKSISENLIGKYSQKLLDHVKQSTADVFKDTSKRVIQKQLQMSMMEKYLKKDIYISRRKT